MLIAIASDHGGYILKANIIKHLQSNGYNVKDFGTNSTESVDYPDYAKLVAESILTKECNNGILVCGTGIGISIAANKIHGIRAALCTNEYMAKMSREHNDSNILALGERVLGVDLALNIVDVWLKTEFLGNRHSNRLKKISDLEKNIISSEE